MKALILVQGITQNNYIFNDVKDWLNLAQFLDAPAPTVLKDSVTGSTWMWAKDISHYDIITSIDTEKYLSSWSLFGVWDRFGDYLQGNWGKAQKVREAIYQEIKRLQKVYGIKTIDALGHSYGSQILAGVDYHFNRLVFAGSPITSKHWYVRNRTKAELSNKPHPTFNEAYYFWSTRDAVCSKPLNRDGVNNVEVGTKHTFYNVAEGKWDCYLPWIEEEIGLRNSHKL